MKVCVLYCGRVANDENLKALSLKLSEGLSYNGHVVDTFDMNLEKGRIISLYDYVVVISTSTSLFSKTVPQNVSAFLSSCGSIAGKRCSCFVLSKGTLRPAKVLHCLMKAMESEGMYLKLSDILKNDNEAYEIGRKLHVESGL